MSHAATPDSPRSRPVVRALILILIAFLAGLAAMVWLLGAWPQGVRLLGLAPAAAPQPIVIAPQRLAAPIAPGDVPQRIAQLENRIDRVDRASREAVGNADRAEGLLVAFAARRALDRGVALGYIEGLLRERFADTQRAAVATIITVARRPITLEQLQQGLGDLGTNLTASAPDDSWWTATQRELGSLITIRREGSTSTVPVERLQRARDRLAAGQVDVALAEVLRLPGQQRAVRWIGEARRYVAARRALDTIETAALLDPARQTADAPAPAAEPAPGVPAPAPVANTTANSVTANPPPAPPAADPVRRQSGAASRGAVM